MIRDASRNLRLLVGVMAAFGMVAAMGAIVMLAGTRAGDETGAITQFGWVAVFIGAALLARWRRHGGFAEICVLLALDGVTHIAGDLWRDGFDPHRAVDGTVEITWDPAIAPTVAVLVVLAIALGCVVAFAVHMQRGPRGASAVHRWFVDYEPLLRPRPDPVAVPGWPPDASAVGKIDA